MTAAEPGRRAALRVLLFGALRDRIGSAQIDVTEDAATVADVWDAVTRGRALADRATVLCARNLAYCGWDEPVEPGDEVAFMPPVSGGAVAETLHVALVQEPIDAGALLTRAGTAADGAVACFVGRVRDRSDGRAVHRLDYEAYSTMAEREMRRIADEARWRHSLSHVALVHRVGILAVGDVAVVVVTASAHRAAALTACAEVIDAVKSEVPIFKREHTDSGAFWVDARC